MIDLKNTPADESKKASFVGGTSKSLQFYALRHKLEWELAPKTRSIVTAMQGAWGKELDIVTMLALSAMPIERDWQRFDEEYEIVDLGRNKLKAEKTYYRLRSQATDEHYAQERAVQKIAVELAKWAAEQIDALPKNRERQAKRATNGGIWKLLSNKAQAEIQTEIACQYTGQIIAGLERDMPPTTVLKRAINELKDEAARYTVLNGCDFEEQIRPLIWQSQRPVVLATLGKFLSIATEEAAAQKALRDRRATVEKTANQLSKLGLMTSDL